MCLLASIVGIELGVTALRRPPIDVLGPDAAVVEAIPLLLDPLRAALFGARAVAARWALRAEPRPDVVDETLITHHRGTDRAAQSDELVVVHVIVIEVDAVDRLQQPLALAFDMRAREVSDADRVGVVTGAVH